MQTHQHQAIPLERLSDYIGKEIGLAGWKSIAQDRINGFADLTEDHQFIHVDPVRAKAETPFNGTIAHGFLSLSLLSAFAAEALPQVSGVAMQLNYGFDKVRFLNPVPSGARLRARFVLRELSMDGGNRARVCYQVSVEIEGQQRPALVAEWLVMYEAAESAAATAAAAT